MVLVSPACSFLVRNALLCLLLSCLCGCGLLRPDPKYDLVDGYYRMRQEAGSTRVYIDREGDWVRIYDRAKLGQGAAPQPLAVHPQDSGRGGSVFRHKKADLDILTTPLKYRPVAQGFPRQLNAQVNGSLFLGYRTDSYRLMYETTPLGQEELRTTHFGFSLGAFAGIGATFMNPWVTRDAITLEYDGLVFSKGVAAIVGVNRLSAGLAFGFDQLLDPNRQYWIYQHRPWLGLGFGLRLN